MQRMVPPHPAGLAESELARQCRLELGRASGPGGQHRNKVETAVRITHEPTGLIGAAGERRKQAENRRVAWFRLRVKLAVEVRTPRDPAAGPSELWKARCRGGKIACRADHADFPAMLAEALDVLEAKRGEPRSAAALLGVTPTQLVKFVQKEPAALERVNQWRTARGLHPLK